jgi:hypothetical protein
MRTHSLDTTPDFERVQIARLHSFSPTIHLSAQLDALPLSTHVTPLLSSGAYEYGTACASLVRALYDAGLPPL